VIALVIATPVFAQSVTPAQIADYQAKLADYTAARAAFVQKKDDAVKKVDAIKKQLGDKWNEVTGGKK